MNKRLWNWIIYSGEGEMMKRKKKSGYKCVLQITREEMKEYGEYFKRMRESIGYSQKAMADELGVFQTTYGRWELGQRIPHQDINFVIECVQMIVKKAKSK